MNEKTMNREIKFRAWDKVEKEWINNVFSYWKCDFIELLESDRYEIMQYTGIKDKNGKEIYEGDVINVNLYGLDDYIEKYYIKDLSEFYKEIGLRNYEMAQGWEKKNIEVIGNKFEDKELCEEK